MLAPMEIAIQLTYTLYAMYAMFVASKGLLRKGLNKRIKQNFLSRQMMFFVIVILSQAPYSVFLL